jgi:hypothetical protein
MVSTAETIEFAATELGGDTTEQAWYSANTVGDPAPLSPAELAWQTLEEAATGLTAMPQQRVNQ